MIVFGCQNCRRVINAPDHLAGKRVKCPGCARVVQVAASPAAPMPQTAEEPASHMPSGGKKWLWIGIGGAAAIALTGGSFLLIGKGSNQPAPKVATVVEKSEPQAPAALVALPVEPPAAPLTAPVAAPQETLVAVPLALHPFDGVKEVGVGLEGVDGNAFRLMRKFEHDASERIPFRPAGDNTLASWRNDPKPELAVWTLGQSAPMAIPWSGTVIMHAAASGDVLAVIGTHALPNGGGEVRISFVDRKSGKTTGTQTLPFPLTGNTLLALTRDGSTAWISSGATLASLKPGDVNRMSTVSNAIAITPGNGDTEMIVARETGDIEFHSANLSAASNRTRRINFRQGPLVDFAASENGVVAAVTKFGKCFVASITNGVASRATLLPLPETGPARVALSTDGRYLATVSNKLDNAGGTVTLWDLASEKVIARRNYVGVADFVQLSPDGCRVFVMTAGRSLLQMEMTADMVAAATQPEGIVRNAPTVSSVTGRPLASATPSVPASPGRVVTPTPPAPARATPASPAGAVPGSLGGPAVNAPAIDAVRIDSSFGIGRIYRIENDGSLLTMSRVTHREADDKTGDDQEIRISNTQGNTARHVVHFRLGSVLPVRFPAEERNTLRETPDRVVGKWRYGDCVLSADGALAATSVSSADEAFITTWDLRQKKRIADYKVRGAVVSLAMAPAGDEIYVSSKDGVKAETAVIDGKCQEKRRIAVDNVLAVSPDGTRILASTGTHVILYDPQGKEIGKIALAAKTPVELTFSTYIHAAVHKDNIHAVVSARVGADAYYLNFKTGTVEAVLRAKPLDKFSRGFIFTADGRQLIATSSELLSWVLP